MAARHSMPGRDVIYNLPREQYWASAPEENQPPPEQDPYKYFQTQEKLPSRARFFKESAGIVRSLRRVVQGYLNDAGIPEHNDVLECVFGRYAVGDDHISDRSVFFYVESVDAFTPEFFRRLREDVLSKYPLWRLGAQFQEIEALVYPHGFLFDQQAIVGRFDGKHPVYRRWRKRLRRSDEESFGLLRRQLAYVRVKLPEAMAEAKERGFALLAVFDRSWIGDSEQLIWLLVTDGVGLQTVWASVFDSAVDETGKLYPQYCERFSALADETPAFWLRAYQVKPSSRRKYRVIRGRDKVVGHIVIKRVIRDAK